MVRVSGNILGNTARTRRRSVRIHTDTYNINNACSLVRNPVGGGGAGGQQPMDYPACTPASDNKRAGPAHGGIII